jgi:glycosyltransferase involved in cell wall biosynthesis
MSSAPKLGLIINTHDQPEYLARVLNAVARQISRPDGVLLADDGSGTETRDIFTAWTAKQPFRCEHLWQKNEGFRRSRILNLAIALAQADYLVFLDGDTVPHPQFVADHHELAQRGWFVQGHRALIEERAARFFGRGDFPADRRRALLQWQISGVKHAFRWPRPLRRARIDLRGIRGCNLGIWRDDLVCVNGYNEAFAGWGREDSELAVRLMNAGVQRLDVRGRALCYHLWHLPASRAGLPANDGLLAQAQQQGSKRCVRGLDQHLPPAKAEAQSSQRLSSL